MTVWNALRHINSILKIHGSSRSEHCLADIDESVPAEIAIKPNSANDMVATLNLILLLTSQHYVHLVLKLLIYVEETALVLLNKQTSVFYYTVKPLYMLCSRHQVIADTFSRNRSCPL